MNLHILTALTRPENLVEIYDSIYNVEYPEWQVFWHLHHREAPSLGGQTVKNALLGAIEDSGWVYVLDDDTTLHPNLLPRSAGLILQHPEADLIFFARADHGHIFEPVVSRGSIDIGQALIQRRLIDDARIPDLYDGDGWFLELIRGRATEAIYVNEPLSFYNRLR